MSQILYDRRCRCKEEFLITKAPKKPSLRSEGKSVKCPELDNCRSLSFVVKYKNPFSSTAKLVLNSFHKKYFYHAVDDLLCFPNLKKQERENLLSLLYSPAISLQNNFFIDFFDIWIDEIYIEEIPKINKFLKAKKVNFLRSDLSYVTIKLFYTTKSIVKDQELLW